MGSLIIVGLAALLWYGVGLPAPFREEVQNAIGALAPWAPLLVALFFVRDAAGDVLRGAWNSASALVKGIAAAIFGVFFLIFIAPIMIADTFLLGDMAHWMWKHEVGPLLLVILSAIALGVLLWWEGTLSYQFSKKYLIAAIIVGVASVAWGYASRSLTNTHRVVFRIKNGRMSSDPAASLRVKGGDVIKFSAFGRVVSGGVSYPPQGNLEDLVGDRPRGEMHFVVRPGGGRPPAHALVSGLESGVTDFAGGDVGYYAGGYYASGEAQIPDGAVEGKLGVGFWGLAPQEGILRLTLQLNPHRSFVGRMMGFRDYVGVLGMLALGLGIVAALGLVMKLVPAGGMRGVAFVALLIAGYVFFVATVGAARRATGVDAFRGLERLTGFRTPGVSARAGAGEGYEVIARVAPGRQENLAQHVPAGARASIGINEGQVWLIRGKGAKPEPVVGQKALEWKNPMILTGDGEVSIWVRPKR